MYCEHCGAKNEKDAKFCEKCGNKLTSETITKEKKTNKLKELPKKTKIIMGIVLIILVIAIITISVLLNNPIKKIEDSLQNYYASYDNREDELENIGKILKNNKKDEKVLKKIKNTTNKVTESWVKNFNTEYKDEDDLKEAYGNVTDALKEMYDYFKNSTAIEYMLDSDKYDEYKDELRTLYNSKSNYLEGKEAESKKDDYKSYYYYLKVDEKDCYYKEVQKYINSYASKEIKKLKEKLAEEIEITDAYSNEEKLNGYRETLKFLEKNKTSNNIDLSSTEEYKKLYEDNAKKVVEYTKKVVEELNEDIPNIVETITLSLNELKNDTSEYKELEDLKKTYEDKMPTKLIEEYRVSNSGSGYTAWTRTINGKEYDFNLHFSFEGKNQSAVYRLNKEFKRLTTTIVRGEDWDESFTGYFVITGDGKELYKSPEITKTSELNETLDIDVSSVEDLKIEFVTSSKASGWSTYYIYLVEPYLYK